MRGPFCWAVTGTFHGSIIEAETEGEARRIFNDSFIVSETSAHPGGVFPLIRGCTCVTIRLGIVKIIFDFAFGFNFKLNETGLYSSIIIKRTDSAHERLKIMEIKIATIRFSIAFNIVEIRRRVREMSAIDARSKILIIVLLK